MSRVIVPVSILVVLSVLPLAAQSPGYWQFVRAEGFESPVYNSPGAPAGYFNPFCPGQVVKSEVLEGNFIKFTNAVPGACNYNKPTSDIHLHHFTTLPNTIQAGEAPAFATDSKVTELINTVAPFGSSSIFGGWVAYDALSNTAPNPPDCLAYTTASNAAGVGSTSVSSTDQKKPELRFKMPAHPWFGSDRNNGMIRFRVFLYTGSIWRMIDRVYQWVGTGPKISNVVNGVTFKEGLVSGSWVSILGSNLAGTTQMWATADFGGNGRLLPSSLGNVRVNINGRAAYVYWISPAQLNVLAPDDDSTGPMQVEVINNAGRAEWNATMVRFSPGFFPYDAAGRQYVIAFSADWNYLAKPGLLTGASTRGARPGETIILYGTGFGPANPKLPSATVVTDAKPLANNVNVTIGGMTAEAVWAGQVGSGLYQIMVKVPEAPDGDQPIVAEIGSVRSPDAAKITIQR